MTIEREECYAPLSVPEGRPDDAPFVYVPLNPKWRDLFVDLCGYLECGCFWAEGEDVDAGYTGAMIAAAQFLQAKEAHMVDVGAVVMWMTTVFPAGWLLCDGDALNVDDYPELFDVLGYTYGGSGATFNLPDMVDRSPMGAGSTVGIGGAAGALAHTLTINQMPAHDHDYAQTPHGHNIQDTGHSHGALSPGTAYFVSGGTGRSTSAGTAASFQNTTANATTGIVLQTANAEITFHAQGGNAPHSSLHPVRGVHFLIWSGRTT